MSEKISDMTIEELNLSLRAYTCLKENGFDTVEQLCTITLEELKSIRFMGSKPVKEIVQKLQSLGLNLRSGDIVISVTTQTEKNDGEKSKFTFHFACGTVEVSAFDLEEAKAIAQSEAIKRGWYYGVLKYKVVHLNELVNFGNLTQAEEIQFRKLLLKVRQGDMYEEI